MERDLIRTLAGRRDAEKRLAALEKLHNELQRNGAVDVQDRRGLFKAVGTTMRDSSPAVQLKAVQLVRDALACFSEIDGCITPLFPRLVEFLDVSAHMELAKATEQVFELYLNYTKNTEQFFTCFAQYGLGADNLSVVSNSLKLLPRLLLNGSAEDNYIHLIKALVSLFGRRLTSNTAENVFRSLKQIEILIGTSRFVSRLKMLPPHLKRLYSESVEKEADEDTIEDDEEIDLIGAVQPTSVTFGVVPNDLYDRLVNSRNSKEREEAADQLRDLFFSLNEEQVQEMLPYLSKVLALVSKLVNDLNFNTCLNGYEILACLLEAVDSDAAPHVSDIVEILSVKLADTKTVLRKAVLKSALALIHNVGPTRVLAEFTSCCLAQKNSRTRQECINLVIVALLKCSPQEFDSTSLCAQMVSCLLDQKRTVRLAAFECVALLHQAFAQGRNSPVISAVNRLELTHSGCEGLMAAVQSRLARAKLPTINKDCLVDYALLSRSPLGRQGFSCLPQGLDSDWIMGASGRTISAASSSTSLNGFPSFGATPVDRREASTPRRYYSAGRSKLPWEDQVPAKLLVTNTANGQTDQYSITAADGDLARPLHPATLGRVDLDGLPVRRVASFPNPLVNSFLAPPDSLFSGRRSPGWRSSSTASSGDTLSSTAFRPVDSAPGLPPTSSSPFNGSISAGALHASSLAKSAPHAATHQTVQSHVYAFSAPETPLHGWADLDESGRSAYDGPMSQSLSQSQPLRTDAYSPFPAKPTIARRSAQRRLCPLPITDKGMPLSAPAASRTTSDKKESISSTARDGADSAFDSNMTSHRTSAYSRTSDLDLELQDDSREEMSSALKFVRSSANRKKAQMIFENMEKQRTKSVSSTTSFNDAASLTLSDSGVFTPMSFKSDPSPMSSRYSMQSSSLGNTNSVPPVATTAPLSQSLTLDTNCGHEAKRWRSNRSNQPPPAASRHKTETSAGSSGTKQGHNAATSSRSTTAADDFVLVDFNAESGVQIIGKKYKQQQQSVPTGVGSTSSTTNPLAGGSVGSGECLPTADTPLSGTSGRSAAGSGTTGGGPSATLPTRKNKPWQKAGLAPIRLPPPPLTDQERRNSIEMIGVGIEPNSRSPSSDNMNAEPVTSTPHNATQSGSASSSGSSATATAGAAGSVLVLPAVSDGGVRTLFADEHELRDDALLNKTNRHGNRQFHQTRSLPPSNTESGTSASGRTEQLDESSDALESGADESAADGGQSAALKGGGNLVGGPKTTRNRQKSVGDRLSKKPTRRSLSNPVGPPPSATAVNGFSSAFSTNPVFTELIAYEHLVEPQGSPQALTGEALQLLAMDDWEDKMRGLNLLRSLSRFAPDDLTGGGDLHQICMAVIREMRNLRSQVSRLAITTAGEMFRGLKQGMDLELDIVVRMLLNRSSDMNRFIKECSKQALGEMREHSTPQRACAVLLAHGASHKNAWVRTYTAWSLVRLVERVSAERLLFSAELAKQFVPVVVNFALDPSPETRKHGRDILRFLSTGAEPCSPQKRQQLFNKLTALIDQCVESTGSRKQAKALLGQPV